jgi:hypothetical protein
LGYLFESFCGKERIWEDVRHSGEIYSVVYAVQLSFCLTELPQIIRPYLLLFSSSMDACFFCATNKTNKTLKEQRAGAWTLLQKT